MKNSAMLFATAALCIALATPARSENTCIAYPIADPPSWLMSAAWSAAQGQVLAVDVASKRILAFNADGSSAPVNVPATAFGADTIRPLRIAPVGDKLLLTLSDSKAITLTNSFAPQPIFDTTAWGDKPNGLGSIYEWIGVNDTTVFGYGAVMGAPTATPEHMGSPFQLGFFFAGLNGGLYNTRLVETLERNEFYLRGFRTMAVSGGQVYYLALTETPEVRRADPVTGAHSVVAGMPAGFGKLETLGIRGSPATSQEIYAALEKRQMVVGIYSDGVNPFVLTRQPGSSSEETTWLLHRLDLATKKYDKPLRLPVSAPHITLAEGPNAWFIFTKDSVQAWGVQPVTGLVRIPATWITVRASSPLRDTNKEVPCRLESRSVVADQ